MTVIGCTVSVLAAVGLVASAHAVTGVAAVDLVTDPAAVAELTPWTGALSTLGLMGWCVAATVLGVAGWMRARTGGVRPRAGFLAEAAVLVALVLLDDAYQLHEDVLPQALRIGEFVIYGVYVAAAAAWAWRRRQELRAGPASLIVAVLALATSVAADAVGPVNEVLSVLPGHTIVAEELLKLAGIAATVAFSMGELRTAMEHLSSRPALAEDQAGAQGAARPVAPVAASAAVEGSERPCTSPRVEAATRRPPRS
jgi:hypothetical protein